MGSQQATYPMRFISVCKQTGERVEYQGLTNSWHWDISLHLHIHTVIRFI